MTESEHVLVGLGLLDVALYATEVKIAFRPSRVRDWRALAPLLRECFPERPEGNVSMYCVQYQGGTELMLVNRQLAGVIIVTPRPEEGTLWLELMAVARGYRGLGLGRVLLERAERRARAVGLPRVSLVTTAHNVDAQRLYERAGYERAIDEADGRFRYSRALAAVPRTPHSAPRPRRGVAKLLGYATYRAVVTWPETGSMFFPPAGIVDVTQPTEARLVTADTPHDRFPPRPVRIRHELVGHPLFSDERLSRLMRRMPPDHVEIRAVTEVGGDYERRPRLTDVDGVAAFSRLGEQRLWMNLHHVELFDPDYMDLMHELLRGLGLSFREMRPLVFRAGVFLLLSSARASVHFHSDPDQSFLFQIRGTKLAFTYPAAILPEAELERLACTGDHGAAGYRPEYEAEAFPPVHLEPGAGVLLPLYAPHRVENGDETSVSLSLGFHTGHSLRRARIHRVGHELRALALPVPAYGASDVADALKLRLFAGVRVKEKLMSVTRR